MADLMTRAVAYLQFYKQRGQGLVEYALVLVLISIVAIVIMTTVGSRINNIFATASNTLAAP